MIAGVGDLEAKLPGCACSSALLLLMGTSYLFALGTSKFDHRLFSFQQNMEMLIAGQLLVVIPLLLVVRLIGWRLVSPWNPDRTKRNQFGMQQLMVGVTLCAITIALGKLWWTGHQPHELFPMAEVYVSFFGWVGLFNLVFVAPVIPNIRTDFEFEGIFWKSEAGWLCINSIVLLGLPLMIGMNEANVPVYFSCLTLVTLHRLTLLGALQLLHNAGFCMVKTTGAEPAESTPD